MKKQKKGHNSNEVMDDTIISLLATFVSKAIILDGSRFNKKQEDFERLKINLIKS